MRRLNAAKAREIAHNAAQEPTSPVLDNIDEQIKAAAEVGYSFINYWVDEDERHFVANNLFDRGYQVLVGERKKNDITGKYIESLQVSW